MELTSIKPLNNVKVNILHPVTNEKTDIFFNVHGSDSKEYRQGIRDIMAARITSNEAGETSKYFEDDEIQLLIKCTIGFEGILIDGEVPEFTEEVLTNIFSEYPFIKTQLDRFIGTKANFFLKD